MERRAEGPGAHAAGDTQLEFLARVGSPPLLGRAVAPLEPVVTGDRSAFVGVHLTVPPDPPGRQEVQHLDQQRQDPL